MSDETNAPDPGPSPILGMLGTVLIALFLAGLVVDLVMSLLAALTGITVAQPWNGAIHLGVILGVIFADPVGALIERRAIRSRGLSFLLGFALGLGLWRALVWGNEMVGTFPLLWMFLPGLGMVFAGLSIPAGRRLLHPVAEPLGSRLRATGLLWVETSGPFLFILCLCLCGFAIWSVGPGAGFALALIVLIVALIATGIALDPDLPSARVDPDRPVLTSWQAARGELRLSLRETIPTAAYLSLCLYVALQMALPHFSALALAPSDPAAAFLSLLQGIGWALIGVPGLLFLGLGFGVALLFGFAQYLDWDVATAEVRIARFSDLILSGGMRRLLSPRIAPPGETR